MAKQLTPNEFMAPPPPALLDGDATPGAAPDQSNLDMLRGMLDRATRAESVVDLELAAKRLQLMRQIREEIEREEKAQNERGYFRTISEAELVRKNLEKRHQELCPHVHDKVGSIGGESQISGQKMHTGDWWLQCSICKREFRGPIQQVFQEIGRAAWPTIDDMGSAAG